jgi:hypothetical protein
VQAAEEQAAKEQGAEEQGVEGQGVEGQGVEGGSLRQALAGEVCEACVTSCRPAVNCWAGAGRRSGHGPGAQVVRAAAGPGVSRFASRAGAGATFGMSACAPAVIKRPGGCWIEFGHG